MSTKESRSVKAVVLDWAGTTVDYGCFAPLAGFMDIFHERGIGITIEEARKPMGIGKKDHIREILSMDRVHCLWERKFKKVPSEEDVESLYAEFEPRLFKTLSLHTGIIPGVVEVTESLRSVGIKIGSTTGYTYEMMKGVAEDAQRQGYAPDCIVTPDNLPGGRPYPWMIYQNAINLQVCPLHTMVKVGDTISDILEGVNAGMWSVGVVKGGNELGLNLAEVKSMPGPTLLDRVIEVRERFFEAGAHYVIDTIWELVPLIQEISLRLTKGERPLRGCPKEVVFETQSIA